MAEKFKSKDDERHRNDADVEKVNSIVIRNEMLEHFVHVPCGCMPPCMEPG